MTIQTRCTMTLAMLALTTSQALAQFDFNTQSVSVGQEPDTSTTGDFDGNGDVDIAVTTDNQDKIDILFNTDGAFSGPVSFFLPSGSSAQALVSGDFDRDGDIDMAVTLDDFSSVLIVVNQGGGTFAQGQSIGVGLEPRHLATADFNGDGFLDLVTSNRDSNDVSVIINNAGTFGGSTTYAAGNDPRGVAAGDYSGDGVADLAISAHDDRQIRLYTGDGDGTFTSAGSLSVGAQLRPDGITIADLDGDGRGDVASATSGNGFNFASVFISLGGGSFGGQANYGTGGVEPGAIVAGDFDVDGDKDLATVNKISNNIGLLPNAGNGTFGTPSTLATGTEPDHLAMGDFNGNGTWGLVAANKLSNTVTIASNNDASWFDLGLGLAGSEGVPVLEGSGVPEGGQVVGIDLSQARASSSTTFIVGLSRADLPFLGGTLVPFPNLFVTGLSTNGGGALSLQIEWPSDLMGTSIYLQAWIQDPAGPVGFAASNGLQVDSQ